MENIFKEIINLKEKSKVIEEKFYEDMANINSEKEKLINKLKEIKLKELGLTLGDKVKDKVRNNEAYLIDIDFRQKPYTFTKEITVFEDFEFRGIFRAIKKDGRCGVKEPLGIFTLENLVKI